MSKLNFVSRHAKSHDILPPIITFDQPLWLKAFSIVNTEPADSEVCNVVVRLGFRREGSSRFRSIDTDSSSWR